MLKDRRILITGGAGFIGSNLAEYLKESNDLVVLDDFSLGKKENLSGLDVEIISASILDDSALNSIEDVDVVFHLAAVPGVQDSIERPLETSMTNFIGTVKILEMMRKKDIPSIIFASSCAVYGNTEKVPVDESTCPEPLSPYASQKLASENMIKNYREIYGIKGISARFFNVYGPKQDPNSEYSAVIPKFIRRCIEEKSPVIYGDGKQTRDFVYVKDLVRALSLIAEKLPDEHVFNIGSGVETSINELAETIINETGCGKEPEYREKRAGEVERSLADIELIKGLGWKPEYSLKDGIKETIEWMRRSR